ncbi:MAG: hypothetical protein GY870_22085, partial [archaeon]|nr:hypothetical protein [archaeon]
MEGNLKVKGLESLNIEGDGHAALFPETLCGSPITFTGTFINPFEIEVTETDFSEFNKNIQTYAELNGIERRVSLDFDG